MSNLSSNLRSLLRDARASVAKAADADCVCVDGPQLCKYCAPHRALLDRIDAELKSYGDTNMVTAPDLSDFHGQTLTPELEAEVKRRLGAVGLRYGGTVETPAPTSKQNVHAKWLREMADECKKVCNYRFANTASRAADEIDALAAHRDALLADRERGAHETSSDAEDAAKWRALRGCARLRAMGSAGLHDDSPELNSPQAHLGLEMWTHHHAPTDPLTLTWLDRFVAKALAVKTTPSNNEEKDHG